MRREVIGALGLTDTVFAAAADGIADLSAGHDARGRRDVWVNSPQMELWASPAVSPHAMRATLRLIFAWVVLPLLEALCLLAIGGRPSNYLIRVPASTEREDSSDSYGVLFGLGALVGWVMTVLRPAPVVRFESLPGASLLVVPLAAGGLVLIVGRWRGSRGNTDLLSDVWTAMVFAFGLALSRWFFVIK